MNVSAELNERADALQDPEFVRIGLEYSYVAVRRSMSTKIPVHGAIAKQKKHKKTQENTRKHKKTQKNTKKHKKTQKNTKKHKKTQKNTKKHKNTKTQKHKKTQKNTKKHKKTQKKHHTEHEHTATHRRTPCLCPPAN